MMSSLNVTSLHVKRMHSQVSCRHAVSFITVGKQVQVGFDQYLLGATSKQ